MRTLEVDVKSWGRYSDPFTGRRTVLDFYAEQFGNLNGLTNTVIDQIRKAEYSMRGAERRNRLRELFASRDVRVRFKNVSKYRLPAHVG